MGNINKIYTGMVSFFAFLGMGFSSVQSSALAVPPRNIHDPQPPKWTLTEYEVIIRALLETNSNTSTRSIALDLHQSNQLPGRSKSAIITITTNIRKNLNQNRKLFQHLRAVCEIECQLEEDLRCMHRKVRTLKLQRRKLKQWVQYVLINIKKSNAKIARRLQRKLKLKQLLEEIEAEVNRSRTILAANPTLAERFRIMLVATDEEKKDLYYADLKTVRQQVKVIHSLNSLNYCKKMNEKTDDRHNAKQPWTIPESIRMMQILYPCIVWSKRAVDWDAVPPDLIAALGRSFLAIQMRCQRTNQASNYIFGEDCWQFIQKNIDPAVPPDQGVEDVLTAPANPAAFKGPGGPRFLAYLTANGQPMSHIELFDQRIRAMNKENKKSQMSDRDE